jgi:hypothetical protein
VFSVGIKYFPKARNQLMSMKQDSLQFCEKVLVNTEAVIVKEKLSHYCT